MKTLKKLIVAVVLVVLPRVALAGAFYIPMQTANYPAISGTDYPATQVNDTSGNTPQTLVRFPGSGALTYNAFFELFWPPDLPLGTCSGGSNPGVSCLFTTDCTGGGTCSSLNPARFRVVSVQFHPATIAVVPPQQICLEYALALQVNGDSSFASLTYGSTLYGAVNISSYSANQVIQVQGASWQSTAFGPDATDATASKTGYTRMFLHVRRNKTPGACSGVTDGYLGNIDLEGIVLSY